MIVLALAALAPEHLIVLVLDLARGRAMDVLAARSPPRLSHNRVTCVTKDVHVHVHVHPHACAYACACPCPCPCPRSLPARPHPTGIAAPPPPPHPRVFSPILEGTGDVPVAQHRGPSFWGHPLPELPTRGRGFMRRCEQSSFHEIVRGEGGGGGRKFHSRISIQL